MERNKYLVLTAHRGFTLIELLVIIAIIAVIPSALLPPVQQRRHQTNREAAKSDLLNLSSTANAFFSENGKVPESFDELADFCRRHPALCDLDLVFSMHIKNGHLFHISSPDAFTFMAEAEPYAGITGSETLFVDLDGNIESIAAPGAKQNQDILLDRIHARAAEKIASLLGLDQSSVNEIRESGLPLTLSEFSNMSDANGDGMLSSNEIFDLNPDNPLEDELHEFLQFAMNEFQPGLFKEDVSLQLIPLVEGGDPTDRFFNYDTLLRLTHVFVTDSAVARSLSSQLKSAAKFARQGEYALETEAAQSYLLLLKQATHQSLTRQHFLCLSFILRITTQNPIQ